MSMHRRTRRADLRRKFKLLAGGKRDAVTPEMQEAAKTPVGKLAISLDAFLRERCLAEPELSSTDVLATLMRMSAGIAAKIGADADECATALGMFIEQEKQARQ